MPKRVKIPIIIFILIFANLRAEPVRNVIEKYPDGSAKTILIFDDSAPEIILNETKFNKDGTVKSTAYPPEKYIEKFSYYGDIDLEKSWKGQEERLKKAKENRLVESKLKSSKMLFDGKQKGWSAGEPNRQFRINNFAVELLNLTEEEYYFISQLKSLPFQVNSPKNYFIRYYESDFHLGDNVMFVKYKTPPDFNLVEFQQSLPLPPKTLSVRKPFAGTNIPVPKTWLYYFEPLRGDITKFNSEHWKSIPLWWNPSYYQDASGVNTIAWEFIQDKISAGEYFYWDHKSSCLYWMRWKIKNVTKYFDKEN